MSTLNDLAPEVTVVILGGGRGTRLDPLTRRRSKPAVPVAGKYRLIDIPISNAINSNFDRMYVLTQFNSVSLHRHISRTYRFDAFSRGYVHILAAQQTPDATSWFQGTADAVRRNLPILSRLRGDWILILAGDHIYRMDYRRLLGEALEHNADIVIGVLPCSEAEISAFGAARIDEQGRIVEFREKPANEQALAGMQASPALLQKRNFSTQRPYLASMGIYLFRKQALCEALDNDVEDFGGDIIPAALERFHTQAYLFGGYWRDIGTIKAFFEAHMDLVQSSPSFTFHDPSWPFYTRPRFLPGAKLFGCDFDKVILADGTHVEHSSIEEAVVGLRTKISGARIKRSLIMGVDTNHPDASGSEPPVGIGPGCQIENAIIDKNARIGKNVKILNEAKVEEADGDGWAIRDGIVVIPKNTVIPDGTVI